MPRKKKVVDHSKGWGCDAWYAKQRERRRCSCGNPAIGLDVYGSPVCDFHNRFPRRKVKDLPVIEPCPGPHI